MKQSEILSEAYDYWSFELTREGKRSAVKWLASSGFSAYHIHKITGLTVQSINKMINPENRIGGARWSFDKFEPKTLDAMILMAVSYEDDQHISPSLVRLVIANGTGMWALSYYTGIPLEDIRRAANDV